MICCVVWYIFFLKYGLASKIATEMNDCAPISPYLWRLVKYVLWRFRNFLESVKPNWKFEIHNLTWRFQFRQQLCPTPPQKKISASLGLLYYFPRCLKRQIHHSYQLCWAYYTITLVVVCHLEAIQAIVSVRFWLSQVWEIVQFWLNKLQVFTILPKSKFEVVCGEHTYFVQNVTPDLSRGIIYFQSLEKPWNIKVFFQPGRKTGHETGSPPLPNNQIQNFRIENSMILLQLWHNREPQESQNKHFIYNWFSCSMVFIFKVFVQTYYLTIRSATDLI